MLMLMLILLLMLVLMLLLMLKLVYSLLIDAVDIQMEKKKMDGCHRTLYDCLYFPPRDGMTVIVTVAVVLLVPLHE